MKTIWISMAKLFAGEADQRDRKILDEWSFAKKQNKHMMEQLSEHWDAIGGDAEEMQVNVDQAWQALYQRLESDRLLPVQSKRSRPFLSPVMKIAAGIALIASLGLVAMLVITSDRQGMEMAARTRGTQEMGITLPDGSSVDLNRESRLKFRSNGEGIRKVTLQGEAYFNVSPDPQRPFIVRAGDAVIRVTGTTFSVRTDGKEDVTEVFVESGHVSLHAYGNDQDILELDAGKLGMLADEQLYMESMNEPNYLSWKTGKLQFQRARLGDIANVIHRTYQKEIRFDNRVIEDCLFTGTFDQEPVDSVVKALQLAFDLDVSRKKEAYLFSGTGCN